MKPRKLKLESGVWRYVVRGVGTTLWTPSGKKLRIMNWSIAGATPGVHTCFDEHCSGRGHPVTPGKLRQYIESQVW